MGAKQEARIRSQWSEAALWAEYRQIKGKMVEIYGLIDSFVSGDVGFKWAVQDGWQKLAYWGFYLEKQNEANAADIYTWKEIYF